MEGIRSRLVEQRERGRERKRERNRVGGGEEEEEEEEGGREGRRGRSKNSVYGLLLLSESIL